MKLKEYLEELNRMVVENPELLECDVVYAHDDEGNNFQKVSNTADSGFFDGEYYGDFTGRDQFEENGIDKNTKPNSVCIN